MNCPFFHTIQYHMEYFKFYKGHEDPTSLGISLTWVDLSTGANRGDGFPLHTSNPVKNGTRIPFPTKEWHDKKPKSIEIEGFTYKLVDMWNGFEYHCREVKELTTKEAERLTA